MKTVLLCGCGNIGYRHLQAMVQMPEAVAITIVEPNLDAHPRIMALTAADQRGHRYTLVREVPQRPARFDLVVIATSADTRRAAFDNIVARHDVGILLFEKVLFQTQADVDAVQQSLAARGIAAYVNCPRRVFPGYQHLQAASLSPVDVIVTGARFGLASNGIHLIDLAEYLNGARIVSLDAGGLQPGWVAAKRAGCIEIFGRITGLLDNGAKLKIICDDDPKMALAVSLSNADRLLDIDELARTVNEDGHSSLFAAKFVSETWEIYSQALTMQTMPLTPYDDSAAQHRLFLAAVSTHLGLAADAACPIS